MLPQRLLFPRRGGLYFRAIVSTLPWLFPSSTSRAVTTMSTNDGPSTSSTTTIAVAQLCATNDKVRNLMEVAKCVAWAKQGQARMLFTPECVGFIGGTVPGETLQHAEPPVGQETANSADVTELIKTVYENTLQGGGGVESNVLSATTAAVDSSAVSLLDGFKTLARHAKMWISIGGLHVLGAPPHPETNEPRFYNTHIIVDDAGIVRAIYRKIHLFDVSIPGKVNLMESNTTAAGRDVVVCDTPVGTCF